MQVQLGNQYPKFAAIPDDSAPTVTYITIPDSYTVTAEDARDIALDFARNPDITKLSQHEAFIAVVHGSGAWDSHGYGTPIWVWSDNPVLEKQLQDFYGVGGRPDNVEETHYTLDGTPTEEQQ
jgi:hypothetical protein